MRILFVCSRNKKRSRTAEKLFRNRQDIKVKSAGFSKQSPVKLSSKMVEWADLILVMEFKHSKRIVELYRDLELPIIEVLSIPDDFEFMDEDLVELLETGTEENIKKHIPL